MSRLPRPWPPPGWPSWPHAAEAPGWLKPAHPPPTSAWRYRFEPLELRVVEAWGWRSWCSASGAGDRHRGRWPSWSGSPHAAPTVRALARLVKDAGNYAVGLGLGLGHGLLPLRRQGPIVAWRPLAGQARRSPRSAICPSRSATSSCSESHCPRRWSSSSLALAMATGAAKGVQRDPRLPSPADRGRRHHRPRLPSPWIGRPPHSCTRCPRDLVEGLGPMGTAGDDAVSGRARAPPGSRLTPTAQGCRPCCRWRWPRWSACGPACPRRASPCSWPACSSGSVSRSRWAKAPGDAGGHGADRCRPGRRRRRRKGGGAARRGRGAPVLGRPWSRRAPVPAIPSVVPRSLLPLRYNIGIPAPSSSATV